ncbi:MULTISPECIES: SMI1/KNR4 family protein [Pseudomonas]|uniref:SMI1/KNR4 family protein n=1 Tax=Pseudomonas eucalypticola TaxID=2599595 RepID=A0A7D5D958_9PSED|nr:MULTISPECIES: SMI1/KNR4 family protein [Pseudomonas]QKZ05075.1 SMI1/KNR4 family protein [Pseudomonas eucalypticola]
MRHDPFRVPTDAEIDAAEQRLGMDFPEAYRAFLKGGSDVADAHFEPAVVLPGSADLDLIDMAHTAWKRQGVPRDLLPFIEDNGDYFCVNARGQVLYWSQEGPPQPRWSSFKVWHEQVCQAAE